MARYRDRDGDVWETQDDGSLVVVEIGLGNDGDYLGVSVPSLSVLREECSPVVDLNAPGEAPLTRAELSAFCAELSKASDAMLKTAVALNDLSRKLGA